MSVALSAAPSTSTDPRLFGSVAGSVIWSGRGTEGRIFIFPASLGIEVPSLAMSKRSPPCLGSEGAMLKRRVCEDSLEVYVL